MSRSSTGFVALLTAGAMAGVGFLAYQADAHVPDDLQPHPSSKGPQAPASKTPGSKPGTAALPGHSGAGERVVYSLGADRVWLVGEDERPQVTYTVTPGTVDPKPGTYRVSARSESVIGSDGIPIEHVVRFAVTDGAVIGFSAAVDGSTAAPDSTRKLGGIRQTRANGNTMWRFAGEGSRVVVVR